MVDEIKISWKPLFLAMFILGLALTATVITQMSYGQHSKPTHTINRKIKQAVFSTNPADNKLFQAAASGDLKQVQQLTQNRSDVDVVATGTPLMQAAYYGHLEVVKFLITKGANISTNTPFGTPLIYAVKGEHLEIVNFFLEKGVDVNFRGGAERETALRVGCANGNILIVKALLAAGADPTLQLSDSCPSILGEAAFLGHSEIVKLLLQTGSDVNTTCFMGWTPLMDAARGGKLNTVQLLIRAGANVNAQDRDGKTALWWALELNHRQIAKTLRAAGAVK